MKTRLLFIILVVMSFTSSVQSEEEKLILFTQMPKSVQHSVLQQVVLEDIRKVELIAVEGVTKYEIESVKEGVNKDITFAENGALLEIETGVSVHDLPRAAQAEIEKDFPTIKIEEIESVQLFYYEVEGQVDGKTVKFRVLATGDIEDSEYAETDDGAD